MKKMSKQTLLLLLIFGLIISCTKEDEPKYAGLGDFSGKYRLLSVNNPACTNSNIFSENDLEILPNGRFKRKMYSLNSNNECKVFETKEGQITITGSFYEAPYGIVKYDNSEIIHQINIDKSINGVHRILRFGESNDSGVQTGLQHTYLRL